MSGENRVSHEAFGPAVADAVEEAAAALSRGEAVVFPTDTVLGLGVSVDAAASPHLLFDIKQRDEGKPVAWLLGEAEDLRRYGADVPELAFKLAERFWPGPLTLVVRASEAVPPAFRGADGSIGLRMPDHPLALGLAKKLGCPLAVTSANIAGEPAPACVEELDFRIAEKAGFVLSCGGEETPCLGVPPVEPSSDLLRTTASAASANADGSVKTAASSGEASTVVDLTGASPRILREGGVKMSDIEQLEAELASRDAGVAREEASFPSADGRSVIHARWWLSPHLAGGESPRAVVQLVHGMAEHIGRYDRFAAFLAEAGFAVCGHDHIGHGKSVSSPDDWGCLPPKTGAEIMVEDVHRMRQLASERFPGVLHVVFGHSMGSFVVRSYVARHGAGLAGAVVCGTGNQALLLSKSGNALANLLCALRGPRFVSGLLHNMAVGAYGKAVEGARTPDDWICADPAVVEAYAADPACGYRFSAGGYAALTSLTAEVVTDACAARVPKDLPLLFIAGAEDPVGDFGRGVKAAATLVEKAGVVDVTTVVYEGMRHEVLNESGRERVWADVAEWMEAHVLS